MDPRKIFPGLIVMLSFAFLLSCTGPDTSQDNANKNQFCLPDSLLKNITFDTLKAESVNSELALAGKITYNEDNVAKIKFHLEILWKRGKSLP